MPYALHRKLLLPAFLQQQDSVNGILELQKSNLGATSREVGVVWFFVINASPGLINRGYQSSRKSRRLGDTPLLISQGFVDPGFNHSLGLWSGMGKNVGTS